jgi:hypothetical protein
MIELAYKPDPNLYETAILSLERCEALEARLYRKGLKLSCINMWYSTPKLEVYPKEIKSRQKDGYERRESSNASR